MSAQIRRGRCLCGAVTYEYEGPENWRAYCHCESCRRATSSPVTVYMGVARDKARFTGRRPVSYHSSPGVRRLFCPTCGSPMAYESDRFEGEIHFFAASLEDAEHFEPQGHVYMAEKLPWFDVADTLPRYPGGGSSDPG